MVFGLTALAWVTRPYWTLLIGESGMGDSTVALAASLAMFLISDGEEGRLLDWPTAARIPWGLLLLFGGGIALARGFTESGLTEVLGHALSALASWPMFAMVAVVCLSVTFLTEVTSNTATTTMLMPILAAAAIAIHMDPGVLMIPATLSASCAFMLPVATPPNAVVMGAGSLTVKQMAREGLVINLFGVVIITAMVLLGLPR